MSLIISNNLNALFVQNNLQANQSSLSSAMKQLSSGLRINSAADDAAGLAIATSLMSQSNGDTVAIQNANAASSLAQIADSGLASITNDLQTLNSLAVQSANGTNSASNRAALQTQAQALVADIQNISSTTNYNGVNLLSGAFNGSFQIGTSVGNTVGLAIQNVQSSALGQAATAGASAQGNSNALAAGDLVINGIAVGASSASSDSSSTTNASSSAISKVAAINAVSSQTGVSATVNSNLVAGASMVVPGASATGNITINGTLVSFSLGTATTSANRQAVVAAINAYTGQTGVTAVDSGSDTTGVQLVAKDGRNINVSAENGVANSGLTASTGVTYGGYTLTSQGGSAITLAQGTGAITDSGLAAGTYQGSTAYVSSTVLTATSGGTTAVSLTGLSSGDITINGVSVGASSAASDNLSSTSNSGSAIAIAAAINAVTSQTGVTASVNANVITGTAVAATTAGHSGVLTINGVSTQNITMSGTASLDLTNTINAINQITGQSGVTASSYNGELQLTAADGRNISMKVGSGTLVAADLGLSATNIQYTPANTANVTSSTYTLSSAGSISVGSTTNNNVADAGLKLASYGGSQSGTFLSNINISTVAGANAAITAVGNALTQVNQVRTNIGAFVNRMAATVSNLQSANTNVTAAYTGITGADFATQTANLSRAQVIQQAGIAILSQANAQSQQVLTLLR